MKIEIPTDHGDNVISLERADTFHSQKNCQHYGVWIDDDLAYIECKECLDIMKGGLK